MVARAKKALTQKAVDEARATGAVYTMGDAACRGLRLWVGRTGTKRWQRLEGSQTIILGDAASMPLVEARQLASGPVHVAKQAAAGELRTIGALVDRYLATEAAHLAKNTRRPRVVRQFLEGLLDKPLSAMTREAVIARQQALLDQGYKGSSVDTYRKGAIIFANWLVDQNYLDRTPFRKMPRIPIDTAFYCLDDAGIVAIENACHRWAGKPDIACMTMLALCSGLRKGEALALEWSDIDLNRGWLSVRAATTKTRKGRQVPMPKKLISFLQQRRGLLPAKRPFNVASVDYFFSKLRASAKLSEHITVHGCRHSFASALLRRGADLVEIRDALGHSSLKQTERYLHKLRVEQSKVAQLIEAGPIRPQSLFKLPTE